MSQLISTEDGSLTLRDEITGELFHNRAGAYTEAVENYLQPSRALKILQHTGKLALLDVCFGLGYNSMVVLEHALRQQLSGVVEIIAIEQSRAVLDLWWRVLESEHFTKCRELFSSARCDDTRLQFKSSGRGLAVNLKVLNDDFRNALCTLPAGFDLVFHDPFSPARVPHLWTINIFEEYSRVLAPVGSVLTYSSAVAVRSALRLSGFSVFRTTGVGGKSGGTLATLDSTLTADGATIFELSTEEEARLHSSSAVPYRDETMKGDARNVLKARQEEHLRRKFACNAGKFD